ncbi:MAG: thiol:disulfide interchange protein DsbA/DsbL [Caldimonas sp.]
MKRRDFSSTLVATAVAGAYFLPSAAGAQGAAPVEGKDYTKVDPPQPAGAPGKVEVLEFFSYACPHCNAFEPTLQAWVRQLPADVSFRRVPVSFLMNAENLQRTYYALETIGAVDAMQTKIFSAIHTDHQRLDKPEDIAAVVAKNGGDAAKFLAAFKSFSVATSVSRARKMTADYKIDGVPSLAIQGRFVTSPSQANGAPQALAVADQLIQRSRAK